MAIQALSQKPCDKCVYSTKDGYCQYDDISETIPPLEPCTDAVSRQWLMRKATERFYTINYFNHITAMIEEAPSVNPQPCDDAISREMALKECHDIVVDGERYRVIQEETLLGLPPVTQKSGKWIPISERLPEENGRYIVTRGLNACGSLWNRVYIINYSDLMGLKKEKIWWSGNVGKSDFERHDDVIAWMPLPKPYEPQESEKINCKFTKCENCINHNYCDFEPQAESEG